MVHVDARADWEASAASGPTSCRGEKRESVTHLPTLGWRPHPTLLAQMVARGS